MTIEGLSEDLAENEFISKFETVDDLANDYLEKTKAVKGFKEQIPEEHREALKDVNDLKELVEQHVQTLNNMPKVPKSVDDYTFEWADDGPADEAAHNVFKEKALELGLTQDQYAGLVDFEITRIGSQLQGFEEQRIKGWEQIQADYKVTEEEGTKQAMEVAKRLKLEDVSTQMSMAYGYEPEKMHPDFAKAMLQIKKLISEDTLKVGPTSPGSSVNRYIDGSPILHYPTMEK